ncbi:acylphosphatase [Bacillus sp. JCM 19034]|uniref:acylphosphatase n=1 Tax=Bacillus sp. JCM 19034 TaxID=1481928 RepID=UPI00351CCB87
MTNEAVEIGSDKEKTKIWLEKEGIPVPKGKGFSEEATDEEIIEYSLNIGFPLVVKPTNGSLGNGVITNIKSEDELKKTLNYVRRVLGYGEVIVERYVSGKEYRIYVIEDKTIAAYNRVPANIIGDGIHTVEELISLKNDQRKKNPRLFSCLIEMDVEIMEALENEGYTMSSVPNKGEIIYLRQKTNVSSGGDPIDVTDDLPESIKEIAIKSINAIPGLYHGGVDIIVNEELPPEQGAVVIELNPTAQIGGILYPIQGKARDIPGAIVDYYFPETKDISTKKSKVYFDLNAVLEPLQNRSAIEVELPKAPIGPIYAKKYIVEGNVNRYRFHRWLKNEAITLGLYGSIKNTVENEMEIVVGGTDKESLTTFKTLITNNPNLANITKISEENYKDYIKVGFEITEMFNLNKLKSVESAIKKLERDLKGTQKELFRIRKENKKIRESRSWKYGMSLKKMMKLVRN